MRILTITVICVAVLCGIIAPVHAQAPTPVIYVNGASGHDDNNGLSWGLAVKTINKGIQRAQEHQRHEVWVRYGEYTECVSIKRYCIQLYGGFMGGEIERDERDWENNVTTIIGKCDDNLQEYCPAVSIEIADNSIVDGFTITGGGGTTPERYGGGFYIAQSMQVWLWNDIITSNTAKHGGGIYAVNSGLWIKKCSINSNTGLNEGGGIFMYNSDFDPQIEYTTVSSNMSYGRGGNMLLDTQCEGLITNDEITNGTAPYGGGIACYNNSNPGIMDNNISSNTANRGGGIYLDASSPRILHNQITSNGCDQSDGGGGIYCNNGSNPTIERNRIKSNTGYYSHGGGIYVNASEPSVINNIIDYNTVKTAGGGMAVENNSTVTVTNNTFAWNQAWEVIGQDPFITYMGTGGAIHIESNSTVRAENNIFYEDLARNGVEVYVDYQCTFTHDYNDIFNNRPYPIGYLFYCTDNTPDQYCPYGPHELYADPIFLDSDYHISWESPVIDKGNNDASGIPSSDYVDGDTRKIDGDKNGSVIVDMGADEYWPVVEDLSNTKGCADNTPVLFANVVVTAAWPDYFYIETVDRVTGIRVEKKTHGIGMEHAIIIYGRLRTNTNDERYIEPTNIIDGGISLDTIAPVGVNTRALGGGKFPRTGDYYQRGVYSWNNGRKVPPWAEAFGLNNIGLLVTTWGKVTCVNRETGNEYFYIDDGSMRVDGTMYSPVPNAFQPNFGVRVVLDGETIPPFVMAGSYFIVTGISSCFKPETDPVRLLRVRNMGDIRPVFTGSGN